MIKAILKPLVIDGKVVPHHFVDRLSTRERGFTLHIENGRKIYAHESGYGYLREDEVIVYGCRH